MITIDHMGHARILEELSIDVVAQLSWKLQERRILHREWLSPSHGWRCWRRQSDHSADMVRVVRSCEGGAGGTPDGAWDGSGRGDFAFVLIRTKAICISLTTSRQIRSSARTVAQITG
jgi:hypothetical protein